MKKNTVIGAVSALGLSGLFAVLSVFAGPLHNLNDIGTFRVRVLFIAMTAAAYALLLLLTAALCSKNVWRMLLRQAIVTAGLFILLTGINQKTYYYISDLQPLIRAMDAGGLSALSGWGLNLSAPAATLLYLVTRGPVYDMYLVKLVCVFCFLLLCVLTLALADRREMGLRAEALFTLCVILPQGFMSAGCTPLLDTVCIALLAVSLFMAFEGTRRCVLWAAAVLYGLALGMSGLALYALPAFVYLAMKKRMEGKMLALALTIPVLCCVPAVAAGVPAGEALLSLVRASFALPEYAAGAPGFMSLIPRAAVSEMPIDMWMRYLPEVDEITNAQPYYTQGHFEIAALGFALAAAAVYVGVCAYVMRNQEMTKTAKAFALILSALILCPGVTNAAWIAAALAGVYAAFAQRNLRLPAFLVIFAASAAAVYPMTEEVLLPMAAAFALCLCALAMTMKIIPTTLELEENEG